MRTLLRTIFNIVATLVLSLALFSTTARMDVSRDVLVSVFRSLPWRWLGQAIAFLRTAMGASVGPESNEMLLGDLTMGVCLALAIFLVWSANRILRSILTPSDRAKAPRVAGAASR